MRLAKNINEDLLTLDLAIEAALYLYPTLFHDKYDVYFQMFFCIGGGYSWYKGKLCEGYLLMYTYKDKNDYFERTLTQQGKQTLQINRSFLEYEDNKMTPNYTKLETEVSELEEEYEKGGYVAVALLSNSKRTKRENKKSKNIKIHKEFSNIMHIPDDVDSTFITAIEETITFVEDKTNKIKLLKEDKKCLELVKNRTQEIKDARRTN